MKAHAIGRQPLSHVGSAFTAYNVAIMRSNHLGKSLVYQKIYKTSQGPYHLISRGEE